MTRRIVFDGPAGTLSAMVRKGADERDTALLFVHAANLQAASWLPLVQRLDPALACVLPDLRGHGRSVRRGPFGVSAWADDAWCSVTAAGAASVHVIGASVGAAVAVELAVRHPEDVLSVTTFGGAFLPVPEEDDPYLTALRSGQVEKAFLRRVVDASVASATPRAVRDRVYREMTENDPETAEAIWRAALATDARDSVEHVAAPALVVTGELDASCPPGRAEWFARAVGGELRVLPGVGHLPMYEAPKLCASLLAEHVQATTNRERSTA